ncbi:MAG: DNA polymerase III subunit alpha [Gammaproteobacteria bacterium]|nr:DNA polymerase III subunit alpha [Gammaproteobacteria bacterium]
MTPGFVHLRVHTEYSLLDSVVRISPLMQACARAGMPAVALTDEGNLFAMVKFFRAAQKNGIKPIIGADLWLGSADPAEKPLRLTLLCQNLEGFRRLSRLVSRGYQENQVRGLPRIDPDWLTEEAVHGLIALSGGRDGDVGRALLSGRHDEARRRLARWLGLFGDRYYIELCRTGRPDEEAHVAEAVALAASLGVPVVATNDVRFLVAEDFEAHEARVCINSGRTLADPGRPREYTEQQYLKSPAEMSELFADLPEALANSVAIAQRCNMALELGNTVLPDFPIPEGMTIEGFLAAESQRGLDDRLARHTPVQPREVYDARLERELGVICGMGFPGYFLIVADFIRWAKDNGIPVGPGRGSGAGSLVAWCLGITDLDPLAHDLLFERFLNPERVSMPDFDVDFCMDGRDRVIDYVAERYGRDRVSQIITYGTMAARAVVRDVGRVLGMPYGYVDRIAKLIPFEIGMTLEKALTDAELKRQYEAEEDIRTLIDLARRLEGLARNAGRHAGGVVIAPQQLTEYTPLYCEEGSSSPVTQFDKDDVEAVGLVKFDFLGLRTLTIIDRAVAIINAQRAGTDEAALSIHTLPMDDAATFRLLKACQTTAVFQLESRGMKDLIKRLQPDRFEDIVALVALFRPGPLQSGMVDDFINRKHGRNAGPIDYLHPRLEPILTPTYGVILYQEQVMQIAQELAGYSLGGADLLRRAMGKKKAEEMAKQRSVFMQGAREQQVDERQASYIFDLMEKFAGYGFNKSHSAAYALLSYQTAWLKAHYPAAFMAAVMSADMDNTDKIVVLKDDVERLGLTLLPPDVNASVFEFTVASADSIRYGLGAIKGLGRSAIEAIVAEREQGGAYSGLQEFCRRVDVHRLNRRAMEALIRAGALDALGPNRASLMAALPNALRAAEQDERARAAGQDDLFAVSCPEASPTLDEPLPLLREWSERDRLAAEKESLGLYLTGHPFRPYREHCQHFTTAALADLGGPAPANGQRFQSRRDVTAAGLIVEVRRRGGRLILTLDDGSARLEASMFEDAAREYGHLVVVDEVVVVEGNLRFDEFIDGWRLAAKSLRSADECIETQARRLLIRWDEPQRGREFVQALKDTLAPFREGPCDVCVDYQGPAARAMVSLGGHWRVRPSRELRERLGHLVGEERVRLLYPGPVASS